MSLLSWNAKKRLIFLLGIAAVLFAIIFLVISSLIPEATCTDGRQNQKEEGVDCGGPCTPCVVAPKEVVSLWTRIFKTGDNVYEAAALIENPNPTYALPLIKYTFKVYDSNNIMIGIKEGQTFLNPSDKFVIFVSGIDTGVREAVRAYVELEQMSQWVYKKHEKEPIIVSKKSFANQPFPLLKATLTNESLFPVKDIEAAAVLTDKEGNAIGVTSTKIDSIEAEGSRDATFSWIKPFAVEPASSQIYTRTVFEY